MTKIAELLEDSELGSGTQLEPLAEFHDEVCRLIRNHYPMNEVPSELVGRLRFLGDQVRETVRLYRAFLDTNLPASREGAAV